MQESEIQHNKVRNFYNWITSLPDEVHAICGTDRGLVERVLKYIELPSGDQRFKCWKWTGSFDSKHKKTPRPKIRYQRTQKTVARVLLALIKRRPLNGKWFALHHCGGHEDGSCVNPFHLMAGTHKLNMKHLSKFGKLKGKNNPMVRMPWNARRSTRHWNSLFKGKDRPYQVNFIRAAMAAYMGYPGIYQLISRFLEIPCNGVRSVGFNGRYSDIPFEMIQVPTIEEMKKKVWDDGYRPKERGAYPVGDKNKHTKLHSPARVILGEVFAFADADSRKLAVSIFATTFQMSKWRVEVIAYEELKRLCEKTKSPILRGPISETEIRQKLEQLNNPQRKTGS